MPVIISGNNTPTAGSVIYGDGQTFTPTAAGTAGQALLSGGSGAPTWGSAGSYTFISTTTASNTLNVDIAITGSYKAYQLIVYGLLPVSNSRQIIVNYTTNNFSTTAQFSNRNSWISVGTGNTWSSSSVLAHYLSSNNGPLQGSYIFTDLANASSTTTKGYTGTNGYWIDDGNVSAFGTGSVAGNTGTTAIGAINGLRINTSGGNISTGTFQLYGIS